MKNEEGKMFFSACAMVLAVIFLSGCFQQIALAIDTEISGELVLGDELENFQNQLINKIAQLCLDNNFSLHSRIRVTVSGKGEILALSISGSERGAAAETAVIKQLREINYGSAGNCPTGDFKITKEFLLSETKLAQSYSRVKPLSARQKEFAERNQSRCSEIDREYDQQIKRILDEKVDIPGDMRFGAAKLSDDFMENQKKRAEEFIQDGRPLSAAQCFLWASLQPFNCGKLDVAKELIVRAMKLSQKLPKTQQIAVYNQMVDIAQYLMRDRPKTGAALLVMQSAIELNPTAEAGNLPRKTRALKTLASIYQSTGDNVANEAVQKQLLSLAKEKDSVDVRQILEASRALADSYKEQEKYDEAFKTIDDALSLIEKNCGRDSITCIALLCQKIQLTLQPKVYSHERALLLTGRISQIVSQFNPGFTDEDRLEGGAAKGAIQSAGRQAKNAEMRNKEESLGVAEALYKAAFILAAKTTRIDAVSGWDFREFFEVLDENKKTDEGIAICKMLIDYLRRLGDGKNNHQIENFKELMAQRYRYKGDDSSYDAIHAEIAAARKKAADVRAAEADAELAKLERKADASLQDLSAARLRVAQRKWYDGNRGETRRLVKKVADALPADQNALALLQDLLANVATMLISSGDEAGDAQFGMNILELLESKLPDGISAHALSNLDRRLEQRRVSTRKHDDAQSGNPSDSKTILKKLLAIREKNAGASSLKLLPVLKQLKAVVLTDGEYDEAIMLQERIMALEFQSKAFNSIQRASEQAGLALLYVRAGKTARAKEMIELVISAANEEAKVCPPSVRLAGSIAQLSSAFAEKGDLLEADRLVRKAIVLQEKVSAKSDTFSVRHQINLIAHKYVSRGEPLKACGLYQFAIDSIAKGVPGRMRARDDLKFRLAEAELDASQLKGVKESDLKNKSARTFEDALNSLKATAGENSSDVRDVINDRVDQLKKYGMSKEAEILKSTLRP
jgi:hypothetical protein